MKYFFISIRLTKSEHWEMHNAADRNLYALLVELQTGASILERNVARALGQHFFFCIFIRRNPHTRKRHMWYLHIYHNTSVLFVVVSDHHWSIKYIEYNGFTSRSTMHIRSGRQIAHKPTWMDIKNIMMNERDKMRYNLYYIYNIAYE